ncbi:Lysophospholipase [Botrytis cinerea]
MKFEVLFLCLVSIPTVLAETNAADSIISTVRERDTFSGYAPTTSDCPSSDRPVLRDSLSTSSQELSWLKKRRANTVPALREFLGRLNITGFNSNSYIDNARNTSQLPNIAIAVSGGGYRALMNGAGAIAAFDNRTLGSIATGLSGGGWLLSSLYGNEFPTVEEILSNERANPLWQFQNPIWIGPDLGDTGTSNAEAYFEALLNQVQSKADAGFNTSMTDLWGRAIAYQLLNTTNIDNSHTFSSIQTSTKFASGTIPMPILVADGRKDGQTVFSSKDTTNYEFNPWEMGSFDDIGFAPLKYIKDTNMVPDMLKGFITNMLKEVGDDDNDIADWTRVNPFYGWKSSTNPSAKSKRLTLVDGGEDLQNIPFTPLIQAVRGVDVIFAVDSSADTLSPRGMNWPNGTAIVATYERSLAQDNGTTFPSIPDINTIVNLGLNSRPTMFGCDARNLSSTSTAPIVVYLPNSPYVYHSNVSTFTMSYELEVRNAIIQNGYDVVTMGNATVDSEWPTCVGCAIMSRSWDRTNTTTPEVCKSCFTKYCWDGTINSTTPVAYEPKFVLAAIQSGAAANLGFEARWLLVATIGTVTAMTYIL